MSYGWMAALSYVGAGVLAIAWCAVPLFIFMAEEVRTRWVCAGVTLMMFVVTAWWIAAVTDAHHSGACDPGQPPAVECVW